MPNHCQNVLKVRGESEALKRFAAAAEPKDSPEVIAFSTVFPPPDDRRPTQPMTAADRRSLRSLHPKQVDATP